MCQKCVMTSYIASHIMRASVCHRCVSLPPPAQGREHHHHGDADHGVRVPDVVRAQHHRRAALLPLQQAVQDAQAGLHRHQAHGVHDVQGW